MQSVSEEVLIGHFFRMLVGPGWARLFSEEGIIGHVLYICEDGLVMHVPFM